MAEGCPGADGLVCVDGWLYSQMSSRMMIFPANKKCPTCNPTEKGKKMSNGLTGAGQGPRAGEAEVATEAREVNLTAVQDDLNGMQEQLAILDQTVQRLQEHLMGAQPALKSEGLEKADRPSPSGKLPILCMLGSKNLQHLHRIQERLNQLCYELGEGK